MFTTPSGRRTKTMNNHLYYISGYWKDDLTPFEDYVVSEYDSQCEDDDDNIFFYGLSRSEAEASKFDEDTILDFVITSVHTYD